MFTQDQLSSLTKELNSSRIKTRDKANILLSYLEGFDIIDTANKIFGYGNWDYTISKLEQVSHETNQKQNHVVCYKAIVQILVHNQEHSQVVSRQDVGFGTGVAKTLADAHENSAKEAVTDALKRCFRSFGNQFGNCLYDKSRNQNSNTNNVNVPSANMQPNQALQNNNPNPKNSNMASSQTNSNSSQPNIQASLTQNNTNLQSQNFNAVNNTVANSNTNFANQNNVSSNQNSSYSNNANTQYDAYEYQSLFNIGLDVIQKNGFLLVTGEDIFSKKDSIKACGFRWDGKTKQWYKQLEQEAA